MEDKEFFTGLFVTPYLYACLLCWDNDFLVTAERRVALCRKGTLYMPLSQIQGVQLTLCEFTILQLLSLKKIIMLFKRYLFIIF